MTTTATAASAGPTAAAPSPSSSAAATRTPQRPSSNSNNRKGTIRTSADETTHASSSSASASASASSPSILPKLPSTPQLRRYFSRRQASQLPSLPDADDFVGLGGPWAWLWGVLFLTAPCSYVYVALVLLRDTCLRWPATVYQPIETYLPHLATLVGWMHQSYRVVEGWCWIEGAFYIGLKLRVWWLQSKDPLEASLSAAPLMELDERRTLWSRMIECETDDPVGWLRGWFFDIADLGSISKYDVRDFLTWSMYEGRHQEHLTTDELEQLECFVAELEHRISLQLYGVQLRDDDEDEREGEVVDVDADADEKDVVIDGSNSRNNSSSSNNGHPPPTAEDETGRAVDAAVLSQQPPRLAHLPKPRRVFRFGEEETNDGEATHYFFSDLYEGYKNRYEQMLKNAGENFQFEFHPVQDLRDMVKKGADLPPIQGMKNLMVETAHQISHAEESAYATASQVYESLVPSGSQMDKHLSAVSHATSVQLTEAWNSVKTMKDRLETARFLSKQRHRIRQQLRGYRVMLNRMRDMSSAVPSKQMAAMMRRITECNQSLELLENRAQTAFVKATGFARKNLPLPFFQRREPQHYARYSSDPLIGIATYPLGLHLLILGGTEIPLRILLRQRGFQRRTIGSVAYYVHPGQAADRDDDCDAGRSGGEENGNGGDDDDGDRTLTPIVFVHGIGIGLIAYMPLIDKLLETGRPILLPEIPYVSAFRPWQSPSSVLSPATVASTMTAMLATHGYLRGTWVGHSYGTAWLSYMIKFAPNAVAAVLFLDPICFCLHFPHLNIKFVYQRPDPGTASYIVRTDVMVSWTIQRSFPWAWILLFVEQVQVPCSVFLSDKDALVPATKVEEYLRKKHVPICDFDRVTDEHFRASSPTVTVFRGDGHGDWVERPSSTVPTIAAAVEILCRQAEQEKSE